MVGPSIAFYTERGLLFHDDCLNVLRIIRAEAVDTIFADPPFNLGKDYSNGKSDNVAEALYLTWCRSWLRECIRILKPGGSLFVYSLPKWNIVLSDYLMSKAMSFRHWIAISMKNGPARGKRLLPAHYSLIYFTKGQPSVFNRDAVRIPIATCRHCGKPIPDWGGYKNRLHPLGVNLSDIWTDTTPVRHLNRKTRPLGVNELDPRIPDRIILLTTNPGDVVMDPFGGGGNTYKAAEKHGRLWLGAEIGDCQPIRDGLLSVIHNRINPIEGPPKALMELFKPRINLVLPVYRPQSALS